MVFAHFRLPVPLGVLLRRTVREVIDDNCLGLAAQLAFYFLLALFPALIFLVALIGTLPVTGDLSSWLGALGRVAPPDVMRILSAQLDQVRRGDASGLLTIGILGAIWSSSTAMVAIISTLNAAYDLEDRRPWYRSRLLAIGLTLLIASVAVVAQALIMIGPWAADLISRATGIEVGPVWDIARWALALGLLVVALDLIYHFAPDARSEFTLFTPGALVALVLWVAASAGLKAYVAFAGDVTATYGTLGGIAIVMLWFYASGFAVLVGAEVNAEIDHASPYRKALRPDGPGGEPHVGAAAERAYRRALDTPQGEDRRGDTPQGEDRRGDTLQADDRRQEDSRQDQVPHDGLARGRARRARA
ncbi:MAG: YihY/virulence factor BrkB family protein [Vicinamibacterales bacterium]